MTLQEARHILLCHSFAAEDIHDPLMTNGFLGSLRPYRGSLNPDNFHQVMTALRVVAPLLEQDSIDRPLISALCHITHYGHAWGVRPWSMLQENNLITPQDAETLGHWCDSISYAVCTLLDGGGCEVAFEEYDHEYPDASSGKANTADAR